MNLRTEHYSEQLRRWPPVGNHILAQFDDHTVVVYQAYRPAIGRFAAENGRFGGEFSFRRMSWIKPNFLWMMYRSGWGRKEGQEITLAIRIKRSAFEQILLLAVHSSYVPEIYGSEAEWRRQLSESRVRLQWDPDHDPRGAKQERRALQLGLSGEALQKYASHWAVEIEDISPFVEEQRGYAETNKFSELITPREEVYPVTRTEVAHRIGVNHVH